MLTMQERLRAADPARNIPPYDAATVAALLDRATDPQRDALPAPRRTRAVHRGGALATAAAGTALALTLGPAVIGAVTGTGGATPAAAQLLTRAADITVSDPPARAEQYYRITTRSTGISEEGTTRDGQPVRIGWRTSSESIQYVAVDGTRPTYSVDRATTDPVQVFGPGTPAPPPSSSSSDRSGHARTTNLAPVDIPAAWQVPTPAWLAALPRDTDALRARMYADAAGHGPSTDAEVLVIAADVMRSGLVPADLRAAVFRVLRTVPGVTVTSEQATLDGRTGVGIGRSEDRNGLRQELVIDPATGQVLGERTLVVRESEGLPVPVGTVFAESAVSRAVVDRVPEQVRASATHDRCEVSPDGGVLCRLGQ
ncbi:MAG: CU044_5270 family protein [Austwickia sp.]|nr:CU044_5270 family protein [Austwickia sp.]